MKKILILTAGFGEGEDVAAWNVREAVEHLAPDKTRIEVLDLLDSCYGRFHDLFRHTFQAAINSAPRLWHGFYHLLGNSQFVEGQIDGLTRLRHSLRDVLRGMEPDVVVSTCPIYGFLIEEIYRHGRTRDFTLISLVTDAVVKDSPWPRTSSDFFAVANDAAARVLAAAGVPEKKIEVFGFPVQFRPTGRREKEIAPPDLTAKGRPRILYLINSARKKSPKLLDRLLEHSDWDVTVCVGRDTDLDEMARAKAATAPERMEVIGHTRRMPQLLSEHHVVISKAEAGIVQEAIAARCPMIVHKIGSGQEAGNFSLLREANAGVLAEKPKEVVDWLERAFRDKGRLLALWRKNLEPLGKPDSALNLARFILEQAETAPVPVPKLRALPAPEAGDAPALKSAKPARLLRLQKKLLLCDLHTHTTWSDGKLTVPEMVDFYGQRGFDCLCITDHLCDPKRLLGKLVNLTGLVIPPGEVEAYFEEIEREKKRAWAKYDLMLMTGVEFNKDGYTAKTSTHLLGVDLKQPIDPSLEIRQLIAEIHAQGGLAVASHPHEIKSEWGKDTLYLWEHVDEYAPLIDAWEVANRDDIFNPVGLKKLPFIANSDFHKPKHIHSWKTLLYCEKEAEAIKHCIRVNRDVSITLYRDHRFGLEERGLHLAALENGPDLVDFQEPALAATRG
ncbi:MAG TPA: PHP domain-containing protein [Candidatus Methylacidiphilales bacterium]|nr:PHP domain-containing protein [Candidatus Methylacidiphilales bacterium]